MTESHRFSEMMSQPGPVKVCIMGTPLSSNNRGVLALASSLVRLCIDAAEGVEVVLLLGQRDNPNARFRIGGQERDVSVVNCRLSPGARLTDQLVWIVLLSLVYRLLPSRFVRRAIVRSTPWIRAVAEADLVGDVRGGDSFSDIYGIRRFLRGFLMAWSVILVKGSIVQFPQTFGPYTHWLTRRLARYLLENSSTIIARDKLSHEVAQALVGHRKKVILSPDVAFSLDAVLPGHIELDPPLPLGAARPGRFSGIGSRVIGLNLNGLMYHGGYGRGKMFGLRLDYASFLPLLITELLQVHDGELWLVPHNFAPEGNVESDPGVSRRLRDELPGEIRSQIRIVTKSYDPHEIKGVIGQCDFFIGSRMHACIAALSQGIPCVGVAYSMKFVGVFDSVGMADWVIDGRSTVARDAVSRVLQLYARREEVREPLRSRSEDARVQLRETFRGLIGAGAHERLSVA